MKITIIKKLPHVQAATAKKYPLLDYELTHTYVSGVLKVVFFKCHAPSYFEGRPVIMFDVEASVLLSSFPRQAYLLLFYSK